MTCIVGYVDGNDIYMGGDSIAISEDGYRIMDFPKVFIRGDMIFGFASSFRMGQILKSSFIIPERPEDISDEEYIQGVFIDTLIKCFEEKGYATIDNNVATGGCFLLGYNKRLYQIQDDFSVLCNIQKYDSIGVGENFALATIACLQKYKSTLKSEEKVSEALEIASKFAYVSKPFHIFKLEGK